MGFWGKLSLLLVSKSTWLQIKCRRGIRSFLTGEQTDHMVQVALRSSAFLLPVQWDEIPTDQAGTRAHSDIPQGCFPPAGEQHLPHFYHPVMHNPGLETVKPTILLSSAVLI